MFFVFKNCPGGRGLKNFFVKSKPYGGRVDTNPLPTPSLVFILASGEVIIPPQPHLTTKIYNLCLLHCALQRVKNQIFHPTPPPHRAQDAKI